MRLPNIIVILLAFFLLCSNVEGLKIVYGDVVSINSPVEDDVFAVGGLVNINAPVDSAMVAGGTLNMNSPIKGDLIAAGGQVHIDSDVGGKIVAAGGNINLKSGVGTNLVVAGSYVNLLPQAKVARDAFIVADNVVNAGNVIGNLSVRANKFQNIGSAGSVDFQKVETRETRGEAQSRFNLFGLLMTLGYLILGLVLLRYLPGLFYAVDNEIRASPAMKMVMGFVLIIVFFIAILLMAVTIVGLPIAVITTLIVVVALMLTGIFVSFSLGSWIGKQLKLPYVDRALFIMGFLALNLLFLLPFVGWFVSIISMSMGFGAFLYAARNGIPKLNKTLASH